MKWLDPLNGLNRLSCRWGCLVWYNQKLGTSGSLHFSGGETKSIHLKRMFNSGASHLARTPGRTECRTKRDVSHSVPTNFGAFARREVRWGMLSERSHWEILFHFQLTLSRSDFSFECIIQILNKIRLTQECPTCSRFLRTLKKKSNNRLCFSDINCPGLQFV